MPPKKTANSKVAAINAAKEENENSDSGSQAAPKRRNKKIDATTEKEGQITSKSPELGEENMLIATDAAIVEVSEHAVESKATPAKRSRHSAKNSAVSKANEQQIDEDEVPLSAKRGRRKNVDEHAELSDNLIISNETKPVSSNMPAPLVEDEAIDYSESPQNHPFEEHQLHEKSQIDEMQQTQQRSLESLLQPPTDHIPDVDTKIPASGFQEEMFNKVCEIETSHLDSTDKADQRFRGAGVCYLYQRGNCNRGEQCRYEHRALEAHERLNSVCFDFQRGACIRGDRCPYQHRKQYTENGNRDNNAKSYGDSRDNRESGRGYDTGYRNDRNASGNAWNQDSGSSAAARDRDAAGRGDRTDRGHPSTPGCVVFVSRFSKYIGADDVQRFLLREFSQYGEVVSVRVPSQEAGVHKNYAFVHFKFAADAQRSLGADGTLFENMNISVAMAKDRSN